MGRAARAPERRPDPDRARDVSGGGALHQRRSFALPPQGRVARLAARGSGHADRKSTRLNSSHRCISYAVFCLKKKKKSHSAAAPLILRPSDVSKATHKLIIL